MTTNEFAALLVVEDGRKRLVEGDELKTFVDDDGVARVRFIGIGVPSRLLEKPGFREEILRETEQRS